VQKLASLPPSAHDFIYFHECAHAHVPTSDELVANCIGLVDMRGAGRSSPAIEAQLAQFHAALGYMGPRYGVGATYWNETVQCANRTAPGGPTSVATPSDSSGTTTTCHFTSGPLSGQVIDFHGRAGVVPAAVGSPCSDGVASAGFAVPASATVSVPTGGITTSCHFQSGPRTGQTIDYAGQPGVTAIAAGTQCSDGAGSYGVAVAAAGLPAPAGAMGMSAKCGFNFGPRAGQVQDYSPMAPLPIGAPCNDGRGSVGNVVP
jgi:hypothetical protein